MTDLFVEPADVLLFRDGRSFSAANSDTLARGVFPPRPTVFYGAIRSALMSRNDADFDQPTFGLSGPVADVVGTKTDAGTLSIARFALARRTGDAVERLYPVPSDVLVRKGDRDAPRAERRYTLLRPREAPGRTNGPDDVHLPWTDDDALDAVYTAASGYLPEPAFREVVSGNETALRNAIEAESLFRTEPRTSVALDDETGTGRSGRLFTVAFTRTDSEVGFLLRLEDDAGAVPPKGWLRLGGEARAAHFTRVDASKTAGGDLLSTIQKKGRFKLVLTTPAVFEQGWRPDVVDRDGRGTLAGCSVQLRGAAVEGHEPLGGWDIAAGRPKTTRRAVPAGGVYFFDLEDPSDAPRLAENGVILSLAGTDDDRKQGLGLAALGTY